LENILKKFVPSGVTVKDVIVTSPKYFKELSKVIDDTPDETIQLFFIWKVIQNFASDVEAEALTPYKRFSKELQGKDPDSEADRWRTCVNYVDGNLGWILSRFFVEKAFSAEAKEFGDRIVYDIKDMFAEKLKITEWMDDSVKELALSKVHNIVQKIGYPTESPNIMDPPSLEKFYEEITVNSTDYFHNTLAINSFQIKEMWSALGKPTDRAQWDMTVPTVNAYYNPPGNEIVFPAGIMQFPVFSVGVPSYLSYGAFGSVAGHELSHAFDSTGRHYDSNGNYTDWWTPDTVKAFEDRAQCFIDQYGNFTVTGPSGEELNVNGRLTLGENIADAGGVAAAFKAWKRRVAEKPDQDLPGLEFFTQDQLFFVNYGAWWCGKSTKEAAVNRIYTDPHAPKQYRILGTMANSRAFRDAFNCPVKEPDCELW
jgi:endothelin-converting enzyme